MQSWITQVRKGITELVVLSVLSDREAYGYEILQRVNKSSVLGLSESSVYPLLARLTREKVLTVRAVPSSSGPPRRYYRLTTAGRHRLRDMRRHWEAVCESISQLAEEHQGDST